MSYEARGLYIETENLETFGENVARSLALEGSVSGTSASRDLTHALRELGHTHERLRRRYEDAPQAPEAAQWLLDNWYLAQREGLAAAAELRAAGSLRKTPEGPLLFVLCRAFFQANRNELDTERCGLYLTGFQRSCALSRAELGLIPAGLRAAAILSLAAVCRDGGFEGRAKDLASLFSSLRLLGALELSDMLERVDRTEQTLRKDPSGVYPLMDEKTRDSYRRRVSQLARRLGIPEHRAAARVLRLAMDGRGAQRHVGYHLFTVPMGVMAPRRSGAAYMACIILATLFFSLLAGFLLKSPLSSALLLLPLSQLVKSFLDLVILRVIPPRQLPRMELAGGIPPQGRCLCVISALLTNAESGQRLARRLEEFRLCSRDCGENLLFGILADLPEGTAAEHPEDRELIGAAAREVNALNAKYGGGFFLLGRPRVYNPESRVYMGWERKRGAILDLARLLCGKPSDIRVLSGSSLGLRGTRYILTLDADTRLEPGCARELVGAMLHPLNTPVVDKKRRVVTAGHAVVQPRMAVELPAATKSEFARVFAGQGGTDPYGCDAGEVYMDLFGRGGFAGKGILDAAVFLECMDGRIPENRVLSHDALEGAYLRGAYMGDVEFTDGFPSGVLSYYRRMHRWVRGDWQNAPWLFWRGRDLPDLERWKLFDSLRRSLVPPATMLAILAGLFFPTRALIVTALIALFTLLSHLLVTLAETAVRPEPDGRQRLLSPALHGASGGLTQTLLCLLLLPYEAWVCGSAAFVALWRMLVSHKKMLRWQTAAQSEALGNGAAASHAAMWPALAAGALCLLFCPAILGRAAGVFWLLSPLTAYTLSRPIKRRRSLSEEDKRYLVQCAAEIWRYFKAFVGPEHHFLPPDNFQDRPPVGAARRCSPTNIGLSLLSALCAADLGVAKPKEAMGVVENLLATVERLPKWNGHLYNWYDTATLKSLHPAYVSSVDSGNLAGCLIVLREGLHEYGRPDLAGRADALLRAMDFRLLFDKSRKLFAIGIETEKNELTHGWYDLLAGEARLLSYIAVALGQAPRKHWRRLGRAQVSCDGYRGMASWTGTMFEYLMPELCLPLFENSMLYESSRFCLYVQKKRTASRKLPWGESESAFFSLDPALSYRYKAHGCARLALRRGMDEELVISPYSSFLALPLDPRGALKNLRKLEALGMRGPFGFWEAVDYTPGRCHTGDGLVVRCVMVHHLGMSMVSIANCVLSEVCRKRFLRDPAMAAYVGFLQEKLPLGGVLLRRLDRETPLLPRREGLELWRREGTGVDYVNPCATLLSNGVYSVMLTESGISQAQAGPLLPYRAPDSPLGDGCGLALYLRRGEEILPLLPLPEEKGGRFSWEMDTCRAVITRVGQGLESRVEASVSPSEPGEIRVITLRVAEAAPEVERAELICLLQPVLATERDYVNQPSYCGLGIHTSLRDGALLVRRLPRGGKPASYLCVACDREVSFSCDGQVFPGRGGLRAEPAGAEGWQSAAQICLRTPLTLRAGSPVRLRIALCLGVGEEESCRSARRVLAEPEGQGACLTAGCAGLLGMGAAEVEAAMDMIRFLVFPHVCAQGAAQASPVGREGLWKLGLSGDMPIVCAELRREEQYPLAEVLLRRHALLHTCGLPFDLVFLTDDGGDYRRPRFAALSAALRKLDRESFVGIPGGIHFIDAAADLRALYAAASLAFGSETPDTAPPRRTDRECIMSTQYKMPKQHIPQYQWNDDNSVEYYVNQSLPPRAWGNVLTNGSLSYLATDCGTGALWFRNARECPVTPWRGEALDVAGPETLELLREGRRGSLFAGPGDTDCRVRFEFGAATWEKTVCGVHCRVTAFIPPELDARVFLVECGEGGSMLAWCAPLQLAPELSDAAQCMVTGERDRQRAQNPRCPFPDIAVTAVFSAPPLRLFTDRLSWVAGEPAMPLRCGEPCLGAVLPAQDVNVLVCGCAEEERLRALCEPEAARKALEETKSWWRDRVCRLSVHTPDEALNHLLCGWCQYQALACRCMARSSLYQSGGAFGFRDQLQDYVNLLLFDAAAARDHILRCCAHQFMEGDVQHWWHPGAGGTDKGVRTRCSDDLLWLPWALCEYTEATGDVSLCHERAPFLCSPPLKAEECARYEAPALAGEEESVLEHARRALDLALARGTGPSGLLLIGSGDWNDGFDRVGEEGRGESVWLSWFFSHTAHAFAALLGRLGGEGAERWETAAVELGKAADEAWDGGWYLRGRYDDGAPLGGGESNACRIDSIAQSFAVLCPEASEDRKEAALDAAMDMLYDPKLNLTKLFDPPFGTGGRDPGYIAGYGPGFRENGGQYTHGALWLALALFRENRPDEGYAVLRTAMAEGRDTAVYGLEPYVLAADIYANPDCPGRGGWSWYTGSAGWFLRVAVQEMLGLRLINGALTLDPHLPSGWTGYTGEWTDGQGKRHEFGVKNGQKFIN